jgi:hypothetical protein
MCSYSVILLHAFQSLVSTAKLETSSRALWLSNRMIIITQEEFSALCLASHSLELGKSITPILNLREPAEVAVD